MSRLQEAVSTRSCFGCRIVVLCIRFVSLTISNREIIAYVSSNALTDHYLVPIHRHTYCLSYRNQTE